MSETYDAVLFGRDLQKGATHATRINKALDAVEPYLGKQGHIREVGNGRYLATTSPHDRLMFDNDHDLAGTERYAWIDGPNGMKLGRLVEAAKPKPEGE